MRLPFLEACVLIALLAAGQSQADTRTESSLEVGYQGGLRFSDDSVVRSRPYFIFGFSAEKNLADENGTTLGFYSSLRGWADTVLLSQTTVPDSSGHATGVFSHELAFRRLSGVWSSGKFRTEIGFQEVAWGETFGLDIADVVNPRDFRDPLFSSTSWTRLPVFAINQQVFLGNLTLQGIFTPVPRNILVPEAESPYSPSVIIPGIQAAGPANFDMGNFPSDSEFGGKASYLFPMGLDLGVLYYHHWNRQLMYEVAADGSTVTPVTDKVDTIGVTGSFLIGDWVIRMDSVKNANQPLGFSTFGTVLRGGNQYQSALGTDINQQNWSIGVQGLIELDVNDEAAYRNSTFYTGAHASRRLFKGKLEVSAQLISAFRGALTWVEPKLDWKMNSNVDLSFVVDLIHGDQSMEEGYRSFLNQQSRVVVWLACHI